MVALAGTLLISLTWSVLAIPLGVRFGIVDRPENDHLKTHRRPTPLLGGVAIFAAFVVGLALVEEGDPGIVVAGVVVLALGTVDDVRGLSPSLRLAAEVGAAALMMLLASIHLVYRSPAGLIFGVILVVVTVNAVNLLDGMDGLSATVGTVSGCGIAMLAFFNGASPWPGLVLAAAILGFLPMNMHPARVFMGDGGAYTLGLILSYSLLQASPMAGSSVVFGIGMLGVFLIDLGATVVRRIRTGRPLFSGDRGHIYDRLHARGLSVPIVVVILGIAQAIIVGIFVLIDRVESAGLQLALVTVLVATVLVVLARNGFLDGRSA